jgi:hypothetical protein
MSETITIKQNDRKLDSPEDYAYECEDFDHKAYDNPDDDSLGFTPDHLFPQREEVEKYGLVSTVCLRCQDVELV